MNHPVGLLYFLDYPYSGSVQKFYIFVFHTCLLYIRWHTAGHRGHGPGSIFVPSGPGQSLPYNQLLEKAPKALRTTSRLIISLARDKKFFPRLRSKVADSQYRGWQKLVYHASAEPACAASWKLVQFVNWMHLLGWDHPRPKLLLSDNGRKLRMLRETCPG